MSEFYQLSNSTNDFKSRSNDVFDRLINLEKQHDVQTQNQVPTIVPDEETSVNANPNIPSHAIVFKKRPADETSFTRPENKWQKYNLDDVNEHHLSETANQRALNDFFRLRPKEDKVEEFVQRPMKKEILNNDNNDDDDDEQPRKIEIRASNQTKTSSRSDEIDTNSFKLSKQKKTRGVFSTNKKSIIKEQINESDDDDEDNDDDDQDEFFEP